ncbi:YceI family protein [Aurantibacillus circumpalustris]|uniref:YceI family protein n=1 Tax=Aurantibacillus circumpalustris TaxID=3036359 RepID=UPI00295A81C0|nr:YceI family protein [Aurantibacillus circumpalustris]
MKNFLSFICICIVFILSAFTILTSVNWKVKENYQVKYTAGGMQGYFKGLKATLVFDEEHAEKSKITAFIDATSLNTGDALSTEHSKEGLETNKFPIISFVSTSILKTTKGYDALGNVTLKGVTRKIIIPFFFDSKKMSAQFPFVDKETFSGRFTISPKNFNITRMGTPEEVTIELTIPVKK